MNTSQPSPSGRCYGWKPDPAHAPRMGGDGLLRSVEPVPSKDGHLVTMIDQVFDQKRTSSCFAQAAAVCIQVCLRMRGTMDTPSRRAIYAMGQVMGGSDAFDLRDEGTVPMLGVRAMEKWGICSETFWPWDDKLINEPVPWDVVKDAAEFVVTGWEKLPLDKESIKIAIASGYPVMFGMPVDQAYEEYESGIYQGVTGPVLGGHMQTIVAYDGDVFQVLNSWSERFGEKGYSRMPSSWLFGGRCSDFYALESTPIQRQS